MPLNFFSETEEATSLFQDFYKDFNIDPKKMDQVMAKGKANETATAVLKATSQGHRECYYPLLMGTQTAWKILTAVRNLWPNLVEFDLSRFSN